MHTLGIRVQPTEITIAVFEADESTVTNIENIKIPKALKIPESLKYARNTILDILQEYDIKKAGIRITESNAQNLNIGRIGLEGVIQEAFASSFLTAYYCGQISTISSLLGIPRADFKKYIEGELNYGQVENWDQLTKVQREALLSAIGAVSA